MTEGQPQPTSSRSAVRVLLIDDDDVERRRIRSMLESTSVVLEDAVSLQAGLERLALGTFDCVLVGCSRGSSLASDFLEATKDAPCATVLLADEGAEESAVAALQGGAQDYLLRDGLSGDSLVRALHNARERMVVTHRLEALNHRLKLSVAELRRLAYRDPLTGLLNRRGLSEILAIEAQRELRSGGGLASLLIDCDDFKRINDVHGHAVGDKVLCEIANAVQQTVRPTDHVARIGGDEFIVLLVDIRSTEAIAVGERIGLALRGCHVPNGTEEIELAASIGCCPLERADLRLESILARAGRALRESKSLGKDTVTSARDTHSIGMRDRGYAETDLSALLDHIEDGSEIHLTQQPIVTLAEQRIVAHELDLRGPPGDYEDPEALLQLAMTAGRAAAMGLSCLNAARARARELSASSASRLHLKLVPTTLISLGIDPVLNILREIRTRSERTICVELSERRLVGDPAAFRGFAERLRDEDMLLALDEMRLSRGSLEALLLLEPAFLKVDKRLLAAAVDDRGQRRILRRLVQLVENRSTETVAVGLETEDQLEIATQVGIDLGQGPLFARAHAEATG